jgi:glutamine cyclotransferase
MPLIALFVRRRAVVAFTLCLTGLGCGDAARDNDSRPSAILPGLAAPRTSNADATPPAVPFDSATPRTTARATASWPHDSTAYTQGLVADGARLLESTGQVGHSGIREVELSDGHVLRAKTLAGDFFGEGVAALGGRIYQLTWQHGRGFVYDGGTLAPIDSFTYTGEGWGLAADGNHLYMSDGTSRIRVIAPGGFTTMRTIDVREAGQPVWMLNELEWVRGELWANIYETDLIARIDPVSGAVRGWIDLSGLLTAAERESVKQRGGTANGIAFDATRGRVLVTGKLWPRIFAIEVPRASGARQR